MQPTQTRPVDPWRPISPSFILTGVLAAFMLFLGVRGLVAPFAAAKGFGLPVVDSDAAWLQIKAGRDLCSGLTLATFLVFRDTRVMAAMLLANAFIPLNDMLVSLSAPLHDTVFALSVHGGAAALMLVLAIVLIRRRRAAVDDTHPAPRPPTGETHG